MVSVKDFYKTFPLLQRRVPYKIYLKSKIDPKLNIWVKKILLLSEIKDFSEAAAFVEAYEDVTHSSFSISNYNDPNRLICKRKWNCNHNVISGLNKKCPATISISLKSIGMLQEEVVSLQSQFPLTAVIKINPIHNHPLVMPLKTTKLLKISNDVKKCFSEYFRRGYFGSRAKKLHEQYLLRANFSNLWDESMNPSLQAIYTLGKNWLKMKENLEVNKGVDNMNFGSLQTTNERDITGKLKKEPDDNDYAITENTTDAIVEDIKPVLTIKQEIMDEDENDGLPVISSYSSMVAPSPPEFPSQSTIVQKTAEKFPQSVATVVKFVQPLSSQILLYNQSSNVHKVVKCLSLNADNYSACQYKSYLHTALVPKRLSL